jgi:hypothetical protein
MQNTTYHELDHGRHLGGGLVQYIIGRMVDIVGGINNGHGRRCQNFCNTNLSVAVVNSNWKHVMGRLQSWCTLCHHKRTSVVERENTRKEIIVLSKSVKHAGLFSSHHIAHTAALLGLAPTFFLDHAVLCETSVGITRKSNKSNSKQASNNKAKELSYNDATNNSHILTSLTRYLRVRLNQEHLTESMAENIICESRRKRPGLDMYFPGQAIYVRAGRNKTEQWCVVNPTVSSQGTLDYKMQEGTVENHIDTVQNSQAESSTHVEHDIFIGSRSNSHVPYEHLEIPRSFIDEVHPSLHTTILHAMAMRPSTPNNHYAYMSRINAIDELHSVIERWKSTSKRQQNISKRWCSKPSPHCNTKTTPDAVHGAKDNSANNGIHPVTKPPMMVLNEDECSYLMLSSMISDAEEEADAYGWDTRLDKQPKKTNLNEYDQTATSLHNTHFALGWDQRGLPEIEEKHEQIAQQRPTLHPTLSNTFELRLGEGGIVYRVYAKLNDDMEQILLPDEWKGFKKLKDFPSNCPVTTSYHLVNDAHAAMTKGMEGSRYVPRIIIGKIPGRKAPAKKRRLHRELPNLIFSEVHIPNQAHIMYRAELPLHAPNLGREGCKVMGRIAQTLGGVRVSKNVQDGWAFGQRTIAAEHLLLSALCVASSRKFLLHLCWRIRKYHSSSTESIGDSFMLAFKSHVVAEPVISYYLLNGEKDQNSDHFPLVIAIPPRRHFANKKGKDNMCFVRLL